MENHTYAFTSALVKTALSTDDSAEEVPLPAVSGEVVEKVVEYMNHHQGKELPIIEKPLRSKVMKDVCKDPWDAEFIDKIGENRQQLYDLILAANYMDIKSLLHLGCAKVASLIKGQPLDKIKEILSKGTKNEGVATADTAATSATTPSSESNSAAGPVVKMEEEDEKNAK